MCGNFGLLLLGLKASTVDTSSHNESFHKKKPSTDGLDKSINESMHEVSRLQGIRYRDSAHADEIEQQEFVAPLKILEAQTACTEIRGGQSGGFSSIEYKYEKSKNRSHFDTLFGPPIVAVPTATRVRMVARKRHPLAADLAQLYLRQRHGKQLSPKDTITVIGHTRFATSSVNVVSELHPHEWVPFHEEAVWQFNANSGKFDHLQTTVGIHISHNGDFDAMEAYSQTMVVEEIGLWLERALHTPNNTRGDSPKIAGSMDLLRVQGRWAAAVRLAWIRCVYSANTDVANGEQLSKGASNSVPSWSFWTLWADTVFEKHWQSHMNNVISIIAPNKFELKKRHSYTLVSAAVKQFVNAVVQEIQQECLATPERSKQLGVSNWSASKLLAFVHTTIRGFLHADLYNCMTELLSRAEGSFGLQAHCTLEPGVVVIASKGQPMSIAFDPVHPIVLFASEAEALAVPVYTSGKWLPQRIDLDSHGEIFRLGEPRALQEGNFQGNKKNEPEAVAEQGKGKHNIGNVARIKQKQQELQLAEVRRKQQQPFVLLDCGVEIRSYSLIKCSENTMGSLIDRSVYITSAPIPYDPKVDLVANDLKVTPAVIAAIDHAWSNQNSVERISGQSLAENLVRSMQRRILENKDTTDLIIGGVEVSLWLGEQFAADLRRIFPNLNVSTVSANKLIGVGDENPSKVFFPSSEDILPRRIDSNTCVLLISQSGQTFPTLHATRKMVTLAKGKVWILTGCFQSKMQQVLMDEAGATPGGDYRNRIFNNYSGHRPAEPSSVAVAATWHTLSRLILHIAETSRALCPGGRFIHTWDLDSFAFIIQSFMVKAWYKMRKAVAKGDPPVIRPAAPVITVGRTLLSAGNDHMAMSDDDLTMSDIYPEVNINTVMTSVAPVSLPRSPERKQSTNNMLRPATGSAIATRPTTTKVMKLLSNNPQVLMNLSDGCLSDFRSLLTSNTIMNLSQIVGYDQFGRSLLDDVVYSEAAACSTTHVELVEQGKQWAGHINESWHVLLLVSVYILLSVGLNLTLCGLCGDALLALIRAGLGGKAEEILGHGQFTFSPRSPALLYSQPIGYTLLGLFLQFLDGAFFVFLGKHMTKCLRLLHHRPLAARMGKRTIVIVDSPCVHQLVESYVSKLFSQSYSILSVEVHGASGLDHFVHRFTHRVVRGVLLAIGRPDGRLCCLSKSEASVLLSVKQAAFICNPDYQYPGAGPEIVTIGHNPYSPNVGLTSNHICLHGGLHTTSSATTGHSPGHSKTQLVSAARRAARRGASVEQLSLLSVRGTGNGIGNGTGNGTGNGIGNGTGNGTGNGIGNVTGNGTGMDGITGITGSSGGITVGGIHASTHARDISARAMNRKKFVDEYLYDRLFVAKKPFTVSILRTLRRSYDEGSSMVRSKPSTGGGTGGLTGGGTGSVHHTMMHSSTHGNTGNGNGNTGNTGNGNTGNGNGNTGNGNGTSGNGNTGNGLTHSTHSLTSSYHVKRRRSLHHPSTQSHIQHSAHQPSHDLPDEPLPYGAHHIDPAILISAQSIESTVFADFVMTNKEMLKTHVFQNTTLLEGLKEKSFDPAVRLAFSSKLDAQARQIQDLEVIIQQLYECRVASLERYVAFCVMFHTMAKRCSSPWLLYPWDIARSQSNLRVATTASPISAAGSGGSAHHEISPEAKKIAHQFITHIRKFEVHF